jgi:hypothetical protein
MVSKPGLADERKKTLTLARLPGAKKEMLREKRSGFLCNL